MNSKIVSILYDEGIYKIPSLETNDKSIQAELHGKKDGQILCLFIREDFTHPHNEELILAENIMKAIKVEKDDYAWAYSKSAIENNAFEHSHVFIFHSGTSIGKTEFPINEWKKINKSKVLRTYSLSDLISDRNKKKELWKKLIDFN